MNNSTIHFHDNQNFSNDQESLTKKILNFFFLTNIIMNMEEAWNGQYRSIASFFVQSYDLNGHVDVEILGTSSISFSPPLVLQ